MLSIKIEIISYISKLFSKLEKVKKSNPYEKELPMKEIAKFNKSSLFDHPQMISLAILEKIIHS